MIVLEGIIRKQLIERYFLEDVDAQNLQYSAQIFVDSMNLIETGHHEVNADRDPDLCAHCVLAGAEESFDSQVLLDPFEEEFDLPATLVNGCDRQGGKIEVVGQEDQSLSALRIDIADTSQSLRVVEFPFSGAQPDRLIAAQSRCLVDCSGLQNVESRVALGSNHKVSLGAVDAEQTSEVEVTPVDHIDAPLFEGDLVEEVHIVNRSIRDTDEHRDWACQVDLSVQFDRCFGAPEVRPREHRQAKIDGRRIHRINHLVQIQPIGVAGIESTRLANENLSECFVNAPVPMLVGVGQVGPGDVPSNAHCVEMSATAQTGFDVPQALPKSNLRESHCQKLVAGRHALAASLHRVQCNTSLELLAVQQIENLSENQTSGVHPLLRMNSANNRQRVQMRDMLFYSLAA